MTIDIETPDSQEYRFYPLHSDAIKFRVRAQSDAHIVLASGPALQNPMYEVFIGGWKNHKSVIRKNGSKPDVVERETPGALSADEFRSFWITCYDKVIAVGENENSTPLLMWQDPELFKVTHFGVRTWWGATGSWQIDDNWYGWREPPVSPGATNIGWNVQGMCGQGTWVPSSGSAVPPNAVPGGFDNEQLYIGRANFNGALIPGKVQPSHGVCYVAWGGAEHGVSEYEVLCDCNGTWMKVSLDNVPPNAVQGGVSESGEPLFIGRAEHNQTTTVGKVQKSHGRCYIPYGGQEIGVEDYEVLILN